MDNPVLHEEARAEYVESYLWYYKRGSHIADAFEREIENALEALRNSPVILQTA